MDLERKVSLGSVVKALQLEGYGSQEADRVIDKVEVLENLDEGEVAVNARELTAEVCGLWVQVHPSSYAGYVTDIRKGDPFYEVLLVIDGVIRPIKNTTLVTYRPRD